MDFLGEHINTITAVAALLIAILAYARPGWIREGERREKLRQLSEADKEREKEIRRLSVEFARSEAKTGAVVDTLGTDIQELKAEIKDMRTSK